VKICHRESISDKQERFLHIYPFSSSCLSFIVYSFSKQMSSSSNASLIASLYNALNQCNRYFAILIFLFGSVGNIMLVKRTRSGHVCFIMRISQPVQVVTTKNGKSPKCVCESSCSRPREERYD
jgi:hypothetical protein